MTSNVQAGTAPRLEAVNDFVVKFANVNGSGSASANELFARSLLRMGVPVSPRNIFPSNIQGLPTWYEVRVNEKGWLARRPAFAPTSTCSACRSPISAPPATPIRASVSC